MARVSILIVGLGLSKLSVAHPFPTLHTRQLFALERPHLSLFIDPTTRAVPSSFSKAILGVIPNIKVPEFIVEPVKREWPKADTFISKIRPNGVPQVKRKPFWIKEHSKRWVTRDR